MSEIDYRTGLSYDAFVEEYAATRTPVLLGDAIQAWTAVEKWQPEHLVEVIGDRRVPYRGDTGDYATFRELAAAIGRSSDEAPGPYMENVNVELDMPELWPDLQPRIPYSLPDWKASRLMPNDVFVPDGMESLFFGGAGTGLKALHYDYYGLDAFLSQIYGEKEFVVFSPEDSPLLHPLEDRPLVSAVDDPFEPDLERFPNFADANPIRLTLTPGQTLYVPNGWWHATRIPDLSITVITQTWNRHNWSRLVKQTWTDAYRDRRPALAGLAAYLTAVWPLLHLSDRRRTAALRSGRAA